MTTNNMKGDFNIENLNIDLIPIDINFFNFSKIKGYLAQTFCDKMEEKEK